MHILSVKDDSDHALPHLFAKSLPPAAGVSSLQKDEAEHGAGTSAIANHQIPRRLPGYNTLANVSRILRLPNRFSIFCSGTANGLVHSQVCKS